MKKPAKKKLVKRITKKPAQVVASKGDSGTARPAPTAEPRADVAPAQAPLEPSPHVKTCAHCGTAYETGKDLQAHLKQSPCGEVMEKAGIKRPLYFRHQVDVPGPTPEQAKARSHTMVVTAYGGRTALELSRSKGIVTYIPHAPEGLELVQKDIAEFDKVYKPMVDYPTGRAAKLYIGFSQDLGATKEAMGALSTLVSVTAEEMQMAQKKKKQDGPATAEVTKESKPKEPKAAKPKTGGPKKVSAASMYRELLPLGKFTDDEIFAKVQKETGCEDKCRVHVSWYRGKLRKDGMKIPDAKA